MSELYMRDVSEFKLFFTTIKNIVDNVKMEINNDGLTCKVLDDSKGVFINIKFNYDYFEYIKLDEVKNEILVVYADDLANVLKNITAEDTLRIMITGDSVDFLIGNEYGNRKLTITQLSKAYTISSPDDFTGETSFTMPFKVLKTVLAELSVFNEKYVKISVDIDDGVNFYNGESMDLVTYENHVYVDFIGSATGVYSIDYLKLLNKFNTLAEEVDLEMNTNSPLKATVTSIDTELSFLIAPYMIAKVLEDSEEDY